MVPTNVQPWPEEFDYLRTYPVCFPVSGKSPLGTVRISGPEGQPELLARKLDVKQVFFDLLIRQRSQELNLSLGAGQFGKVLGQERPAK